MMHLMESEWGLLMLMLSDPDKLKPHHPLMAEQELEARCDDIMGSMQFNHHDKAEWELLMTCIQESDIHEYLKQAPMSYEMTRDMVDAAYSLQDRFAARFPVNPSKWFNLVGQELDEPIRVN